jgi:hypothetical protein
LLPVMRFCAFSEWATMRPKTTPHFPQPRFGPLYESPTIGPEQDFVDRTPRGNALIVHQPILCRPSSTAIHFELY